MHRQNLLVLILFFVLTTVMTYPLLFHLSTAVDGYGDPFFNAWTLAWNHHQIFADPIHLFDTNIFYPHKTTLAYSEHLFASALLSLPVYFLGGNPISSYNVVLFLSFVLCGWGMFLLVRQLTGSALAGLLAGMAFAFSSYRFSQMAHFQILTAQWMPFALLYLHRAFDQPRWKNFALFGLFLLLQLLSCNYLGIMFVIAVGVLLLGLFLLKRKEFGISGLIKCVLTLSAVGLLFLPFAAPYVKVQKEHDFRRSWEDLKIYSAKAENYLGVSGNHKLYPQALKEKGKPERRLFFGFWIFGLALLPFFFKDKKGDKIKWIYGAILFLAFLLSMGSQSKILGVSLNGWPYRFFYDWMPGFDGMRVPARFGLIVGLALAVLGGMGVASLLARLKKRGVALGITCIVALGIVADGWCAPLHFIYFEASPPPVHIWLKQQEDVEAIVYLPAYSGKSTHREMNYTYWSTHNWKKMVNGYSGFFPPGLDELKLRLRQFPSKETIDELRQMGVNYCIVNNLQYESSHWAQIQKRLTRFTRDLELIKEFESAFVYRIKKKGM